MMKKFLKYLRQVKAELKKIHFSSGKEIIVKFAFVVVAVFASALFFMVVDFLMLSLVRNTII